VRYTAEPVVTIRRWPLVTITFLFFAAWLCYIAFAIVTVP
jgi:hypothetical protein